ncbi:putative protein.1 [BD1-7 clade bacterium]|uniref:Tautomerase family protein n=1 Tax=BD1-7 clade bacterium TaxID=2029982 RepID=A0A5S9PHB9_9GAMM|nr:putative protein.1 [BD1-7 clade bacterium]CAA0103530.1 putative protein.1 [BD1-7 clade bacterium]
MIVIYGIDQHLNPIKKELSDAIHHCMMSVLGMPEDKRAHRFMPMHADDFFYPGGRSDKYTVIEINMMEGRQKDTIKALIYTLFEELEQRLALSPIDVEITIKQQPPHCWGFRGVTGDDVNDLKYQVKV